MTLYIICSARTESKGVKTNFKQKREAYLAVLKIRVQGQRGEPLM
jgi:hypothetical protein